MFKRQKPGLSRDPLAVTLLTALGALASAAASAQDYPPDPTKASDKTAVPEMPAMHDRCARVPAPISPAVTRLTADTRSVLDSRDSRDSRTVPAGNLLPITHALLRVELHCRPSSPANPPPPPAQELRFQLVTRPNRYCLPPEASGAGASAYFTGLWTNHASQDPEFLAQIRAICGAAPAEILAVGFTRSGSAAEAILLSRQPAGNLSLAGPGTPVPQYAWRSPALAAEGRRSIEACTQRSNLAANAARPAPPLTVTTAQTPPARRAPAAVTAPPPRAPSAPSPRVAKPALRPRNALPGIYLSPVPRHIVFARMQGILQCGENAAKNRRDYHISTPPIPVCTSQSPTEWQARIRSEEAFQAEWDELERRLCGDLEPKWMESTVRATENGTQAAHDFDFWKLMRLKRHRNSSTRIDRKSVTQVIRSSLLEQQSHQTLPNCQADGRTPNSTQMRLANFVQPEKIVAVRNTVPGVVRLTYQCPRPLSGYATPHVQIVTQIFPYCGSPLVRPGEEAETDETELGNHANQIAADLQASENPILRQLTTMGCKFGYAELSTAETQNEARQGVAEWERENTEANAQSPAAGAALFFLDFPTIGHGAARGIAGPSCR